MKVFHLLHALSDRFPLTPPSPARGEGGKVSLREEN
jgi:hypothetical protein